jgi:hypothetical protein
LRALVLGALLILSTTATGLQIERIDVWKDGKMYRLSASSEINAPPDFILDILLDFDNFHRLSRGMVLTRYLPPDDSGVLVGYTLINSCVWIFCKRFEKVERMWAVSSREIVTVADPERSDFEFYSSRWRLEETENGTRLMFDAAMQPDFWVPPMMGLWAVKRKLRYTAEEIGLRVEHLHATGTPLSELPATSREE